MRIDVHSVVPQRLADDVWRLYTEAFDELRTTAVQRHLMTRDEFDEAMRDTRLTKYLGFETDGGDRLRGLSTLTSDLAAVPLVSMDYFRQHWPEHFAAGRIWYIGFLAVHPQSRGTGLFEQMILQMYRAKGPGTGVVAFDVCRRNEDEYQLPRALRGVLEQNVGEIRAHRLDEQTYWLYELPTVA